MDEYVGFNVDNNIYSNYCRFIKLDYSEGQRNLHPDINLMIINIVELRFNNGDGMSIDSISRFFSIKNYR